ncbi:hypothetical protein VTL71DRAFT_8626 [Oculimacula yallundae]|uniref:Uncharacterized protein n=1 Tax=Oculimacula yallundae TaxID=86028 RepID=A0ABR4CY86_9HELO
MSIQDPKMETVKSELALTTNTLPVHRPAVIGATLHNLTFTTSTFTNCILSDCIISESTLTNCAISNSVLNSCTVTGASPSQKTISPFTLRKLPYELREMVFKDCLEIKNGKSPALMVALRGDKELYEHALKVYYRINYYTIDTQRAMKDQAVALQRLSQRALLGMKKLRVDVDQTTYNKLTHNDMISELAKKAAIEKRTSWSQESLS